MSTTPSTTTYFCHKCHQSIPPKDIFHDSEDGEMYHAGSLPHDQACNGLVSVQTSSTLPHGGTTGIEAQLISMGTPPSLEADMEPSLIHARLKGFEGLSSLHEVFTTTMQVGLLKQLPTHCQSFLTAFMEEASAIIEAGHLSPHTCPDCRVSLIPSPTIPTQLKCPLCPHTLNTKEHTHHVHP